MSEADARRGVPLGGSDTRRKPVGVVRIRDGGQGFMASAAARLTSSLAPKTQSSMRTALRAFREYLLLEGLDLAPFIISNTAEVSLLDQSIRSETIFMGFAEYLVTYRRVQVNPTAKTYVRSVRAQLTDRTGQDPALGHDWRRLTRLFGRLLADYPSKRTKRNPILQQHLLKFREKMDMTDTSCKMYWALALLLFFGVSRKGDHLPESRVRFNPDTDTTRSDLQARDVDMYVVKVKQTKTRKEDLNFDGKPLVRVAGNLLCPVTALEDYLTADPLRVDEDPTTTPLFRHQDGSAVSRADIHSFVKIMTKETGLKPENYGGHSFRIGGATAALCCEAGDKYTVQVMGMWLGDSVGLYTRPTVSMIKVLLKQMMSSTETIVTGGVS